MPRALKSGTVVLVALWKGTVTVSVAGIVLLILAGGGRAQPANVKHGPMAKIGFDLANLYEEYQAYVARQGSDTGFTPSNPLLPVIDNRVVIDAVASGDADALKSNLKGLGLQKAARFRRMVSGQLPISALRGMAGLARLKSARPAYAMTHAGQVTSQGDEAMRSDIARSTFGVDGSGVTLGVLSDSFDCLGDAASDVGSGDLPDGIVVLDDSACGGDEGRAMMQVIHDVAPGASQAFHTAFNGQADFAAGIVELADIGAEVIVDDVIYFAEPMFQDGIVAQAVDTVEARGVSYFSAAGNGGRDAYENPFAQGLAFSTGQFPSLPGAPAFFGGVAHNFGGGDFFQSITIPTGTTILSFQWDDPFFSVSGGPCRKRGANTDLDIYLLADLAGLRWVVAGGVDNNTCRGGSGDPVEVVGVINNGPPTTFDIMVVNYSGPNPEWIKYVGFGGGLTINEFNTDPGTIYGHANAAGAEAVGAAYYGQTPEFDSTLTTALLEPFSSAGPTVILFETNGTRKAAGEVRNKPEIVAPDCINTTFFYPNVDLEPDGYPNFCGTSAAAPHAGGVAALMLQANPDLLPADVYTALEETAIDMEAPGFDFDSGFGLIQADQAVEMVRVIPTPGITVSPTSGLITTEGGGTATFTVVLKTVPSADVTISLSSSDLSEGTVSPPSLTFTQLNGTTPQTVTLSGVDDIEVDGDVAYTIVTDTEPSGDPDYNGINPDDVSVTNMDDDTLPSTGVHIGDLDGDGVKLQKGYWKAIVTITVHDGNHDAVGGAQVTGTFSQNGNTVGPRACTTNSAGTCSIDSEQLPSKGGTATFTVESVSHASGYDFNTNHDVDGGDSNGTTITISK